MNQDQRLDYLLEQFKADSLHYKGIPVPALREEKKVLLRSLMNIRMPKEIDSAVLQVQDEYLRERSIEKGIVEIEDIPTISKALLSRHAYGEKLSVWQGDITRLKVGAIVNAANSAMLGCFVPMHTCIDNCIHTYAGIQLRSACNQYMEKMRAKYGTDYAEPTGQAMITRGYNLPAQYVIHTVGPIVEGKLEEKHCSDLKKCYESILNCCLENGIRSVAFCCISCGVFHFPNEAAAHIAVDTVTQFLKAHADQFDRIIFNVFKDEDKLIYERLLK